MNETFQGSHKHNWTYLKPIVRPGCKMHGAVLCVEREVANVDGARAFEYDHGEPRDIAIATHDEVRGD